MTATFEHRASFEHKDTDAVEAEARHSTPAELVARLRVQVGQRLTVEARRVEESDGVPPTAEHRAELVRTLVREALDAYATASLRAGVDLLHPDVEGQVAKAVRDALIGLGGLQPLLDDDSIEDIAARGYDTVFVKRANATEWEQVAPVADSDAELVELIRRVAARSGNEERRFDRSSPILSCELADGSRLHAVQAVSDRVLLSIRRHRFPVITLDQLVSMGMLDVAIRDFLVAAVRSRRNIVISGETGSGKTTLIRGCCDVVPAAERMATLEDTFELGLHRTGRHPNTVALQAREANVEGHGRLTLADLFPSALRMRPDRVIVGEVRGGEIVTMLNAMSNGNDGSLSTIHASSSQQVFLKMAAYAIQSAERLPVEATNLLVASAVHVVVHLALATDGMRVVSSVREITGTDGLQVSSNEIFAPDDTGRAVPASPMSHSLAQRLQAAGFDACLLQRPQGWWERPS